MTHDDEDAIAEVTERLRQRFPGVADAELVKAVNDSYHDLDGATIRSFVGILVEKQARDLLEH